MAGTAIDRINGINSGVAIKAPVRVATTAAITLSGLQIVDGVLLVADDRVLVKNQASSINNGIYTASTGAWTRTLDCDGSNDMVTGTTVYVNFGTSNANTAWMVSTTGTILPGTSAMAWTASANLAGLDDYIESIFSPFILTLADDTTAAIARATLGAVGLTGDESVAGKKSFTGVMAIPAGASGAGNLGLHFGTDTNTGLYLASADQIAIQTAGSDRVVIGSTGVVAIGASTPNLNYNSKFHIRTQTDYNLLFGFDSSAFLVRAINDANDTFMPITLDGSILNLSASASIAMTLSGSTLTFADAKNMAFNTTTGTKIGTGTTQKIGFWNATPVVKPTVTGSRGGNAALASLLTALASMGLVVDSSS